RSDFTRDDFTRELVQAAHEHDPDQVEFDVAAGLADVLGRGAPPVARVGGVAVMLVESTSLLRGALAMALSAEADLEVVAELGRIDTMVPVARAANPDVVVVGADLLDGTGTATLEEL